MTLMQTRIVDKFRVSILTDFNNKTKQNQHNSAVLTRDLVKKTIKTSIQVEYHIRQQTLLERRYITQAGANTPIHFHFLIDLLAEDITRRLVLERRPVLVWGIDGSTNLIDFKRVTTTN